LADLPRRDLSTRRWPLRPNRAASPRDDDLDEPQYQELHPNGSNWCRAARNVRCGRLDSPVVARRGAGLVRTWPPCADR